MRTYILAFTLLCSQGCASEVKRAENQEERKKELAAECEKRFTHSDPFLTRHFDPCVSYWLAKLAGR